MPKKEVYPADGDNHKKNSKLMKDEDLEPEVEDDIENGPVFKRHCTDILCCPLFIAFCVGMAWALAYGLSKGDPMKLLTLYDYDAHGCGYDDEVKDFDYIYWPNLDYSSESEKTVCVKFCPTIADPLTATDCYPNTIITNCVTATPVHYDSKKYMNKFCIPDTSSPHANSKYKSFKNHALSDYGNQAWTNYMGDLIDCWWVLLVCAFIAFAIGILYLFFIRFCSGIIIWFTIFSGLLVLVGAAVYLYFTADKYDKDDPTRNTLTYISYIIFGIGGLYIIILLCCCGKIRLGIAIMKTAANFIRDTYRVFLVPIFFFFCILVWMTYWVCSAVFIWSVGDVKKHQDTPFASIHWSKTTRWVFLYDLFGMFWINAFLISSCQFILAVGVCTWYFTHTADSGGSAQLYRGFVWILRYHLGSIAFGSMIIAICEFARFMFNYYRKFMMSRMWTNA